MSAVASNAGSIADWSDKKKDAMSAALRGAEIPWDVQAALQGYQVADGKLPKRTKLNALGKSIVVKSNVWACRTDKAKDSRFRIYQFDVDMKDGTNNEPTLRKVKEKAWYSQATLKQFGKAFMYDGNKLAWSLVQSGADSVKVDLNEEDGRGPTQKPASKQVIVIRIKPSKVVTFEALSNMLDGKGSQIEAAAKGGKADAASQSLAWSEALNVLEHVHHQTPRTTKLHFRKAFYSHQTDQIQTGRKDRAYLGEGVEAAKGVFVSMRATILGLVNGVPQRCLSYNVDLSNCAFWIQGKLTDLLRYYFEGMHLKDEGAILNALAKSMTAATKMGSGSSAQYNFYETQHGRVLSKLKRVRFTAHHLQKKGVQDKQYCIADIMPIDPFECQFEREGKPKVTVAEYFWKQYKIKLAKYPLIKTTSGIYFPMDVVHIAPDQRFTWKLNERQVSRMLEFAVQLPQSRWEGIEAGVRALNWSTDPWMKEYGIQVNPRSMDNLQARLLPCPDIKFKANATVNASEGVKGRWRIDGKKFLTSNLDSRRIPSCWGIAVSQGDRIQLRPDDIDRFAKDFQRIYAGHGGKFDGTPYMWSGHLTGNSGGYDDIVKGCIDHAARSGKTGVKAPQFLFFVVPDQNPDVYKDIKRNCDLRLGIASQVMQAKHVAKCQPQYISNICLKVNAKLGGSTCHAQASATKSLTDRFYSPQTRICIMGADVTHGPPGGTEPSIAALTMSKDCMFNTYMGLVESNGYRQEMIQTIPLKRMFKAMTYKWAAQHQGPPSSFIYMRDGVSTEQCFKVISEEVRDLKDAVKEMCREKGKPEIEPKFTVIVCSKRHHVRIFPKDGDRNGNALPGTLLETGATLAADYDWYLNSHVALKGTSRPMHYILLQNESNMPIDALQQFIFENCLQYCRATTPVSQFPAIAYAHLAAARGKLHLNQQAFMNEKKAIEDKIVAGKAPTEVYDEAHAKRVSEREAQIAGPNLLMNLGPQLVDVMWYV